MGTADSPTSPWFASSTITADEARLALAALAASSPTSAIGVEGGVFPSLGDPFRPTSNGTAAAPRVSVAPGTLSLQRPVGGPYIGTLPSAVNVTVDLPLPSSGQTRIDLLVAEIIDSEADGGAANPAVTALRMRTIPGTPSSSPVPPTPGAGQEPLWRWTVNNGGSITNILSLRRWTRASGGVRYAEAGDTRPGTFVGDLRIFATGQMDVWMPVDSVLQWQMLVPPPLDASATFTVNTAAYQANDSTRPLRAFVDARGAVRLAGFIRRTGANTGVAAGVQYQLTTTPIPAAIRPTGIRDMLIATSFGPVDLAIRPNGHIFFMPYAAATLVQNSSWWSFDSVTYQQA